MSIRICCVFFLAISISTGHAQKISSIKNRNNDSLNTHIKDSIQINRLILSSGGLCIANWAVYQPFKEAWWQERRTGFHLYRGYKRINGYWDFGWDDSLYGHLDKLGHFYSSKLLAESLYDLSRWIGYDSDLSYFIGSTLSFLLMLEIEIYDSFFEEWGFSLADLTANALGAYSPLLSQRIAFFNRFRLKLSYYKSEYVADEKNYIKDYTGMTFWLSYDVNRDLPVAIEKYWPDFLNLAIGYGVDRPSQGKIELYLSPDINWSKIIKVNNYSLNRMLHFLDYIHFPCFAWQFSPRKKFYQIYF